MNGKLLIADDDARINELLRDIFTMEGYEVCSAYDGQEVLNLLETERDIDLLLLDIMMPVLDGWDVLRYIKEHFSVKVVVLTALGSEASEVRGLREGADDFVSKPFSRPVLLERVRRLVVQKQEAEDQDFCCGPLCLSQRRGAVFIRGEPLTMTRKEFLLLHFLMSNAGLVMSRDQILESVWDMGFEGDIRVVDSQVKLLRRSLGAYGSVIRTVRGMGYCFDGEVTRT